MGCNTSGEAVFAALLGSGCQHRAAAEEKSNWCRSGTCSHLQGKGAACLSIMHSLLLLLPFPGAAGQELSTASAMEPDQELQPCCTDLLKKPGRGGEDLSR